MKIHNIVIIFVAVVFAIFIPYNYTSQRVVAYNRGNIEYANILTAACHDAAKTIEYDEQGTVFATDKAREKAIDAFYNSLASAFHYKDTPIEASIAEKTPFVMLVDTNGFYISVNAVFDEYENYNISEESELLNVMTTLNTWTDTFEGNIVRFYLTDYVEVTLSDYAYVRGTRAEVYNELSVTGRTRGLEFLSDEALYEETKINAITGRIEDTINYILNTQTVNVDGYNTGYHVTLARSEGEDWARLLKNPTVISFLQGDQEITGGRMLDVYAYAAGEITKSYPYYINGECYYWSKKSNMPVGVFYGTMEECARKGAVPASE